MAKRDLISEIEAKKLRATEYYTGMFGLFPLQQTFRRFENADEVEDPLFSLFVVGIVACIEVQVRTAIRRLIDYGPPYVDRIAAFKDVMRLDVNIGRALQDRRISFGDLISHLLPVSNVEQINSHFEVLFARDFKAVLADIREFVEPPISELLGEDEKDEEEEEAPELDQEPSLLPIPDVDALLANLGRLFRARHNAAHEADFESISKGQLINFFRTAELFLHALEEIVSQIVEPNASRTAMGMSLSASREASKAVTEMQSLEEKLTAMFMEGKEFTRPQDGYSEVTTLKTSQEAFQQHLDAELELELACLGIISGNGIRTMEARTTQEFCESRIKRLKEMIDHVEFLRAIKSL